MNSNKHNLAYHDDRSNWQCSCLERFEDTKAYYAELWRGYYNGLGVERFRIGV